MPKHIERYLSKKHKIDRSIYAESPMFVRFSYFFEFLMNRRFWIDFFLNIFRISGFGLSCFKFWAKKLEPSVNRG